MSRSYSFHFAAFLRTLRSLGRSRKKSTRQDRQFPRSGSASITAPDFEETLRNPPSSPARARSYFFRQVENTFLVHVTKTRMDSAAYSLLTRFTHLTEIIKLGDVGTASIVRPGRVLFFKGDSFVKVFSVGVKSWIQWKLLPWHGLAEQLDAVRTTYPSSSNISQLGDSAEHVSYAVSWTA